MGVWPLRGLRNWEKQESGDRLHCPHENADPKISTVSNQPKSYELPLPFTFSFWRFSYEWLSFVKVIMKKKVCLTSICTSVQYLHKYIFWFGKWGLYCTLLLVILTKSYLVDNKLIYICIFACLIFCCFIVVKIIIYIFSHLLGC